MWIHLRMDYKKYIPSEEVRNTISRYWSTLISKLSLIIRWGSTRLTSDVRRRRVGCTLSTRRASTGRPPPPCPRPSLATRSGSASPRCTPATPSAGEGWREWWDLGLTCVSLLQWVRGPRRNALPQWEWSRSSSSQRPGPQAQAASQESLLLHQEHPASGHSPEKGDN